MMALRPFLGGVENIEINKKMVLSVRAAREYLDRRRALLDSLKKTEKRKLENELQELKCQQKNIRLKKEKEEIELRDKIR